MSSDLMAVHYTALHMCSEWGYKRQPILDQSGEGRGGEGVSSKGCGSSRLMGSS